MFLYGLKQPLTMLRKAVGAFAQLAMIIILPCFLLLAPLVYHVHLVEHHEEFIGYAGSSAVAAEEVAHDHENKPAHHSEDCQVCYLYAQLTSGFEVDMENIFDCSVLEAALPRVPHDDHEAATVARRWDSRAPPARI